MGIESAGYRNVHGYRNEASPVEEFEGDVPPEIGTLHCLFLDTFDKSAFSNNVKIKWSKSEEKLNFRGRCHLLGATY